MKQLWILLCALALFGCDNANQSLNSMPAAGADVAWLNAPGSEDRNLPFSSAVRVDNTLYVSGMIGVVPGTMNLAEGGIQGETRQTLENISATLSQFGSSMENVVKCTVFLADMSEWAAMNEVYTGFFPNKPARSAVGVNGLALGARLEIECIAVIR